MKLGYHFNQNVNLHSLPKSLSHKEMYLVNHINIDYTPNINNISPMINYLMIGNKYTGLFRDLPKQLEQLKLVHVTNKSIDEISFLSLPNLINLAIYSSKIIDKPIEKFPNNLTHLKLPQFYNFKLDNLPPKLTHLTFDER